MVTVALRRRGAALLLAVLAVAACAGCAMFRKYDMVTIHRESAAMPRNPVIVLHGFLGSKLKNAHTEESVWGRFKNAILHGKTDDIRLPTDRLPIVDNRDDLVPYAIFETVAGVKFYGAILDALGQIGRYRMGDIDDPKPGDNLFVYMYDWRRDNVESAIGLGRAIARLKSRLGAPDLRFDIVAHSMGGMVAEYYLKYGAMDILDHPEARVTWAGARDLGRVVLIGTPRLGTMSAFRILNTGISRTMSPEIMFTLPAVYQLLPHDGRPHFVDSQGTTIDLDLYDAATWIDNGWSIFGRSAGRTAPPGAASPAARYLQAVLDRARAFHAAMTRAPDTPTPAPIHLFGSDCIPTLDRVILKPTPAGTLLLFDDDTAPDRDGRMLAQAMLAPGDGTVTAESLLASQTSTSNFFFCETHGLLPANRGFQDNLFYVLLPGTPHVPAPRATTVSRPAGKAMARPQAAPRTDR